MPYQRRQNARLRNGGALKVGAPVSREIGQERPEEGLSREEKA